MRLWQRGSRGVVVAIANAESRPPIQTTVVAEAVYLRGLLRTATHTLTETLSMAVRDERNDEHPDQEQGGAHEDEPAILTRIDATLNRMIELHA